MQYIHTDQFPRLAYRKLGNGPVVVLLHGFPENGNLWRNIWPALSENHTVIIPDLPGSGESTFTGETLSMEQLANSVKLILDKEGIEELLLAGHSMGGYIALAFAERYGQMLNGLSLVHSTAAADTDDKKENRRRSAELIQKGGKEPFVKQMIPNLFFEGFKREHPEVIEKQVQEALKIDAKSLIAFMDAMRSRPERTNVLKNSSFPIQFIVGKNDNVIPFNNILQQSHISSSNFVSVYQGCGHMSMLENSKALAIDMEEFISYCYQFEKNKMSRK